MPSSAVRGGQCLHATFCGFQSSSTGLCLTLEVCTSRAQQTTLVLCFEGAPEFLSWSTSTHIVLLPPHSGPLVRPKGLHQLLALWLTALAISKVCLFHLNQKLFCLLHQPLFGRVVFPLAVADAPLVAGVMPSTCPGGAWHVHE